MTKSQIVLVIILLTFHSAYSQTKEISGDTLNWFKTNKIFQRNLKLKDFEKSTDEFDFRFSYYGQVIEITKDGSDINSYVTNYTYHNKRANGYKTDTLSNKVILSPEKAKSVYNIITNSGILKLPSDNKIKNWQQGADGITYIVEYADKKNYSLKTYWEPSDQDSIPEALIMLSFIKKISEAFNLDEMYTSFKNGLPRNGCYNSGGMSTTCYISNSYELGYSSATKMPFGFYASYKASYIGKTQVNSAIALQYNFKNDKFYHLNFALYKWNILSKDSQFSDFIAYNYQDRKIDIENPNNEFKNHQIKYGLNLKNNFSIGAGVDYLLNGDEKIGTHLYASKYFPKLYISTIFTSSVFNDQINYKAQIFKSFYLNQHFFIRSVALGLAYENFMHYKDLSFNFQLSF
ncbi:hypothetical protein FO440_20595 [Mucilaginibacter corticis]|uniref:Porin n=1 Tax=Mucilaginibacter corticis TaxID=2597670 RepID=A0A556MG42_9SPHI|nr:hypothetical protein [Mucilaginibacter corticis]TSJ38901.1 hypothetical protein FO440_20595 [Mucilaginibacter corticis]